ncbi:glycosyltransferase [Paenibacillus selenitireducens]|uniref:Glycosyltransferase n=1 Tax=Paenibacillus selenitireducens TaxID=1324314 RepID=A0A1T2X2J1_9BACL|nr:glycosyltransferase [Paenibacillus selenitireducens]OPA74111.1 glycosyltransferase [Paenibacillus selenitireducens]
MKIIIIGPIPPPIGGISIHLRRLSQTLAAQKINHEIYNEVKTEDTSKNIYSIRSYTQFMLKVPFIEGDLFHFHTIDKRLRMLLGCYVWLGKKIILTVHGDSLVNQLQSSNGMTRRLLLSSLKRLDSVICVNEATTAYLLQNGLRRERVTTIPAYINPMENPEDIEAIPNDVYRFMNNAEFIISANGYVRFYENQDLYGIDLLIQVMEELKKQEIPARLIFALMGVHEQSFEEQIYYKYLKEQIALYSLEGHFYFYEVNQTEFYPIVRKSHLFIRPTNTDGYGVSIAEALHYRIPSIASDVCKRPEGTLLFESRNIESLIYQVHEVITNYSNHKDKISRTKVNDYSKKLIDVYYRVTGKGTADRSSVMDAHG